MSYLPLQFPVVVPLSSAFTDFVAAVSNVEAGLQRATKRAEEAFRRAEDRLRSNATQMEAVLAALRAYVQAGGLVRPEAVTDWIEQGERATEQIARDDAQVRELLGRVEKLARKGFPEHAKLMASFRRRYESVADGFIKAFENAVLELRVVRAESLSADEQPEGPVFSNAKELRRHLKSLH